MIRIAKMAFLGLSMSATAAHAAVPGAIAAACCAVGACCGLGLGCC
jgi:hypothetical protein